jgi:acyl dehydratase
MLSKNCLTASMLEVGQRYTKTFSFSADEVAQYCALSGDRNSIHRDPAAARLRFEGASDIVVPGGLIQISITGIFGSEFPGDGCLGLAFVPERLRKPVFPGDEIEVEIEITKIRGPLIEVDILMKDGSGDTISTAKSKLLGPDETYREWWLQQS